MPVGGYKGYGLAVIVELLAGALAGAALGPELENMGFTAGTTSAARPVEPSPGSAGGTGHLFLAIAVERFLPLDEFTARVDWLARLLKSSELAEGSTGVLLPGEREWLTERRRRAEGVPLEASVAADLRRLADELQVAFPEPVAA
jgi:LDH2 family malate/lactate/ureidoglycolate dehydrogenase